ncbi:MAG: class IV adenylate cyclase [Candidatus Doudnabacteria bacterium]|nr:class IV adenylate cyclase [Candidatus Doudnabacteria bacterium]
MENREIEVKFLEIDKPKLIEKLVSLGATDLGEELITEQIFHDTAGEWYKQDKFARIRKTSKGTVFTYKHTEQRTATGTLEIEFKLDEPKKMKDFLEALGLVMDREQEKKRHKFMLGEVVVDIDTWPSIPTYVELEGPSEESIKKTATELGFDWTKGVFGTAARVIMEMYKLDLRTIRYFTFDKVK